MTSPKVPSDTPSPHTGAGAKIQLAAEPISSTPPWSARRARLAVICILLCGPALAEVTVQLKLYFNPNNGDYLTVATEASELDAMENGYRFERTVGFIFRDAPPETVPLDLYRRTLADGTFQSLTVANSVSHMEATTEGYSRVRTEGFVYPATRCTSPSVAGGITEIAGTGPLLRFFNDDAATYLTDTYPPDPELRPGYEFLRTEACIPDTGESLRILWLNSALVSPVFLCLPRADDFPVGTAEAAFYLLPADFIGPPSTSWLIAQLFRVRGCFDDANDRIREEADRVAGALGHTGSWDIIALAEVFNEDAREILADKFASPYPHYVSRISRHLDTVVDYFQLHTDSDVVESILTLDPWPLIHEIIMPDIEAEDSGLMLFSRFPFARLPHRSFQWARPLITFETLDATTDEVAFVLFESESGSVDSFAAKGAALIRVEPPGARHPFNVTFTHLQAPSRDVEIRKGQIAQMEDLIEKTLGTPVLNRPIVAVGDFNVDGLHGNLPLDMSEWPTFGEPGSEWLDKFSDTTAFFNRTIIDGWAATSSKADEGITARDPNKRLDYAFVTNDFTEQKCVQHIRNLQVANSDHLAIGVDLNRHSLHCSPRTAMNLRPVLGTDAVWSGTVERLRGARWARAQMDTPGTVGIFLTPEFDAETGRGFRFEVYSPDNLSSPLVNVLGRRHPDYGQKFLVPRDFFIKVFSPDGGYLDDFELRVHRMECQSVDEACFLWPNGEHTESVEFRSFQEFGRDDAAWFHVDVTEVPSRAPTQRLRIFADGASSSEFTVRLLDLETLEVDPTDHQDAILGDAQAIFADTPEGQEAVAEHPKRLIALLMVGRLDADRAASVTVGWDTNLTLLHGLCGTPPYVVSVAGEAVCDGAEWRARGSSSHLEPAQLKCLDETNGNPLCPECGTDEIHLQIKIDNAEWKEVVGAHFDCDRRPHPRTIDRNLGLVGFVDRVEFKIIEADGSVNPDDAGPIHVIVNHGLGGRSVFPQPSLPFDFEGGEYELKFLLSKKVARDRVPHD